MKRLGVFGGTFDPVHNAHLELAQAALEQQHLDCVLFVPAGLPVRKLATTEASAEHRLRMLELACKEVPGFCVSSLEVDRPHISYTVDTLHLLQEQFGKECALFLILGEDTVTDISTWKDSHDIAQLAQVLYAKRPGGGDVLMLPRGFRCCELQMPAQNLSSSSVRAVLRKGEDASACVPASVIAYIKKHGLYGKSQSNI